MPVSEKMSNSPRRAPRRSSSKRRVYKRKERNSSLSRREESEQKSFFSWIFSWSLCTSSSMTEDVLEPSAESVKRASLKSISFDRETPSKSSKSSNRQSLESCKVTFSFDDCEYASDVMEKGSNADMYNFYPGRGDGPGVSPLKSILKRQSTSADEHDAQSPPTSSMKHRSPEFIDALGFRENPLANSTRGKTPQTVSTQPKMRYLVPDACADEEMDADPPLHRTSSFERPAAAAEHQRHLESSFQWKRNMEEEDFRLALSLAEEEINGVQQNALKSQLASASSSSLSTLTRSSSWHQQQASYNIASSSFDLYSSPASEKVPSPRSRPTTIQSSSAKGPSFQSPQKFVTVDASPKPPMVGSPGVSLNSAGNGPSASPKTPNMSSAGNGLMGSRPVSVRKQSPLPPSKGLDVQPPVSGNRGSINRRRIPTPMEAQEMLLEFAMRASLEEEERKAKLQQRLEIREKLALSKALVASVDANAFTM